MPPQEYQERMFSLEATLPSFVGEMKMLIEKAFAHDVTSDDVERAEFILHSIPKYHFLSLEIITMYQDFFEKQHPCSDWTFVGNFISIVRMRVRIVDHIMTSFPNEEKLVVLRRAVNDLMRIETEDAQSLAKEYAQIALRMYVALWGPFECVLKNRHSIVLDVLKKMPSEVHSLEECVLCGNRTAPILCHKCERVAYCSNHCSNAYGVFHNIKYCGK
jgi:hypothetical protein